MAIPERKFGDWKSTGADNGSQAAKNMVYNALRSERSPLEQKGDDYWVKLQGSYSETTHTYGTSDVDVIAKITSAWRRDLSELSASETQHYENDHCDPDYAYEQFREDVHTALTTKFGHEAVQWGGKAIEISSDKISSLAVDVDVVPCGEYRVYYEYPADGSPEFTSGMYFKPRFGGEWIINYPTLHIQNGKEKYTNTNGNYKETVRIFKNTRDYINKQRVVLTLDAPSYYITCLLYNLDDGLFKTSSRSDRYISIVEELEDTDISGFEQQSGMTDLFGDRQTQWSVREAETFIGEMRNLWENNSF